MAKTATAGASNSLNVNNNTDLCPRGKLVRLDTLGALHTELARLYRMSLKGVLSADTLTKYAYVMREMRGFLEAQLLEDVQTRLADLAGKVGARRG